jgi:hypothetical protein
LFAAAHPVSETASATYSREQAREKPYKAEPARLDLDERLFKLVAVNNVAATGFRIGAFASALLSHETVARWIGDCVVTDSGFIGRGSRCSISARKRDFNEVARHRQVQIQDAQPPLPNDCLESKSTVTLACPGTDNHHELTFR